MTSMVHYRESAKNFKDEFVEAQQTINRRPRHAIFINPCGSGFFVHQLTALCRLIFKLAVNIFELNYPLFSPRNLERIT